MDPSPPDALQPWFFQQEPRGKAWRELLTAAGASVTRGLLVLRTDAPMAQRGVEVLAALTPWRIPSQAWPLPGPPAPGAEALWFRVDEGSLALLARCADGLYEWTQPDLPEDLCLFRPDGAPWLITLAHARDASLLLHEAERRQIARRYPSVAPLLG